MFKKKKKLQLSSEDLRIIRYSLVDFRNNLNKQNRYSEPVDEIILKLKSKMKVDRYDLGIIINSLTEYRKMIVSNNKNTNEVDKLILKLIDLYDTL